MNNNRAALVSWTPLTLHQARGLPVYFVTYQSSAQVGRVARAVSTVNTTNSSVVIDDLDPTTEYTFTVDGGTAGGKLRSTLAAGQSMMIGLTYMLPMLPNSSSSYAWTGQCYLKFHHLVDFSCYLVIVVTIVSYIRTIGSLQNTEYGITEYGIAEQNSGIGRHR